MRIVLLIPAHVIDRTKECAPMDERPMMDYEALGDALSARPNTAVRILDYTALKADRRMLVRLASLAGGYNTGLATAAWLDRRELDAVFSNAENVAIPLAIMLKFSRVRPRHVVIGHRLSAGKKRLFFTCLRADKQMDRLYFYSTEQRIWAGERLGIPVQKLRLVRFQVDQHYFNPACTSANVERLICSAGLEWRDYPTLIESVKSLPDVNLVIASASPWSKRMNEIEDLSLPDNVRMGRFSYSELRALYARAAIVVVPLYDVDFQAGITTLLEAMAMAKAVVVTRTYGQTDVVIDGETGTCVEPGNVACLREAIQRLLGDAALRKHLGANARRWVEENATLEIWVNEMMNGVLSSER